MCCENECLREKTGGGPGTRGHLGPERLGDWTAQPCRHWSPWADDNSWGEEEDSERAGSGRAAQVSPKQG